MTLRHSLLIFFFMVSMVATAQEDDTIRFVQGLAEAGTDSSLYDDVNFSNPPPHYVKLNANEIPGKLEAELDNDELFSNWRKGSIWRDKKTGLYWLYLTDDSVVRSYGFTEDGNNVSLKVKNRTDTEIEKP